MCLLRFQQVLSNSLWNLAILDALQYASFSLGGNVRRINRLSSPFVKFVF